jgi:hypothetical protein
MARRRKEERAILDPNLFGSVPLATKLYSNKIEDCYYRTRNSKAN